MLHSKNQYVFLEEKYIDQLPEWNRLLKPLNSYNLYIILFDGDVEMDCK